MHFCSCTHLSLLYRSFAIGIGPVPFVMIPEVSPLHVRDMPLVCSANLISTVSSQAVSALSSVGLSLNCESSSLCPRAAADVARLGIANFLVGLVFLPLRNQLSGGDPYKEGRIFYLFASMLAFCTLVLFKFYRG